MLWMLLYRVSHFAQDARGRLAFQECQWQGATVKLTRMYSQRLLEGEPSSGAVPRQYGKCYILPCR
jgi:hypothetical protein